MVYMRSDGECCAYIDRGVKHKVRQRFGKIEYSNNNNNNDDDHRQWQPNRMNTSTAQSAHEATQRRQLFCHRPQWMLNAKCILKLHEINKLPVAFLCVRINHQSMVHYDVNYFGAYRMICWSANRKCCPMISLFCCFIFRGCCCCCREVLSTACCTTRKPIEQLVKSYAYPKFIHRMQRKEEKICSALNWIQVKNAVRWLPHRVISETKRWYIEQLEWVQLTRAP